MMETVLIDSKQLCEDYSRIEQAIRYLEAHFQEQPSLEDVARQLNLSEYHFQRMFKRWAGISPKRFLQYLTKEYAKHMLENSQDVLTSSYSLGLSSSSRLHDLFVTCEAVTPGEYKNLGRGLVIRYGYYPSPFGECLIAMTERGICHLVFISNGDRQAAQEELRRRWRQADFFEDQQAVTQVGQYIFPVSHNQPHSTSLYLRGTNFQIKVWEALLRVPSGRVITYQDLAFMIGLPAAARAVGNAVASNPIPVVIPCHRVLRKSGDFGNYRYGSTRKKAMLGWEFAQEAR